VSINKLTFTDYFRKFLASVYFLPKGVNDDDNNGINNNAIPLVIPSRE
jgi:hypothetical protein